MRTGIVALVATTMLTSVAHAADKPIMAPPPSWVGPVTPSSPATVSDGGPVQLLLVDQQVALERGRRTVYSELVVKIATPQGLSAGNISVPWRPDSDTLTVHRLVIRRGDQTINVLGSGQTFTVVRREQNLESATLDGVLTANIQPEGLQVGDTLDFAASVSSTDPTLKNHVEYLSGGWNALQARSLHLRVQWPADMPVRVRAAGSLPAVTPTTNGGVTAYELSLKDVKPVAPPSGAPARYRVGRVVEMTDFASWADPARLMAPLYERASTLPAQGALRAEIARIRALSPDPKLRAEAALALVQDRVRYVALVMGAGGYDPADAETTWSRRYGDCKGKTALLLALLHAMDIRADPVMVSSGSGDGIDARLPLVGLFDHVLVRAEIGKRVYWLDGTRTGDTSLDRLTVPAFGWGLPLVASNAALVRMQPLPLAAPTQDTLIRIDASAGIAVPAPTRVETILRGDDAVTAITAMANMDADTRDRTLRDYWKGQYDFIDVTSVASASDPRTGEQHLMMEGSAKLDWANGNYQTDGTGVGYRADFARQPGPDSDAPFAVSFPYFTRTRETIVLPKGMGEFKLGSGMEVDQTAGGIAYHRHAAIKDGVFTIERSEKSVMSEFPAKNAAAEQAALRMLADRPATLRMPNGYRYSGKDIAAVLADVPTTSAGYVSRAKILVGRNMRKEALLDYDRAVELDPNNVYAWANRGITRVQAGELAGARADLDKAELIEPGFVQTLVGRGMLAEAEKRPADAVKAYSAVLEQEPKNAYALRRRAAAFSDLGDVAHTVADLTAIIALQPDDVGGYFDRGDYYLDHERFDEAIVDFDHALTLDPRNGFVLADRGMARVWKSDYVAGAKDLDAAFAIDPRNPVVFRGRALIAQFDGRSEDAVAAYTKSLELDPGNGFALGRRAQANRAARHFDAALADAEAALCQDPRWLDLRILRANIYRQLGHSAEAGHEADALSTAASIPGADASYADVAAAKIYAALHRDADAMKSYDRALARKPESYIYLNRADSRSRDDMPGALADVEAALKLEPDLPEAIVFKAEYQVRAGNLPGAIATYSSALAKSPDSFDLLTGRGIVYARAGQTTLAERDLGRARAKASSANSLNSLCWAKATAGVALESALADCNAALLKERAAPAYLDSRGLVLLRLGRLDAALADYDQALTRAPDQTASLFGRAVVWSRKGDRARAATDAAAATKLDPDIAATFERFGVKL